MAIGFRQKWVAAACLSGLLALPALADGREHQQIAGPDPLQPAVCEHGQYTDGRCYVPNHQPTVTRIVRSHAPVTTHRVIQQTQPAQTYDFSGFTGGVGSNVSGGFGFGGGGNVIILRDGQRFSGIRNSAVRQAIVSGAFSSSIGSSAGCGGC